MSAPRLAPFFEVCHDRGLGLSALMQREWEQDEQKFVVLKSGYAMGCWWKRGDVVVCARTYFKNMHHIVIKICITSLF